MTEEIVGTVPADRRRPSPTSPLRMWGYAAVLTALAFVQSPGRIVADTKFDLVVDPWGFLGRALTMWDGQAAFGQVQNQAYGYLWPMGPFFGLGELARLPEWIVQRLWWALLLCLSFVGVVRLCQRLGLGRPGSQVVAGFAFALSPHAATILGASSVELWPTALAPWVLLPLVDGVRGGSERRAAARSALVVACCGGVNAVAVSAVLPLGAIWIWTRSRGPRRWRLFWWWTGGVVLATLWWWVPLLLMGGYAAPFLDYIESAAITTSTTGLVDTLIGTSNWVAYASRDTYPAGFALGTTAFLIIDAAVVAGFGMAGMLLRDNPHRRFLLLSVTAGVVLVGFGYTGDLHGWFAAGRQELLDGPLAPFRNVHKFDVVVRLPLVLGLAHVLGRLGAAREATPSPASSVTRLVPELTVGVALVGLVTPWLTGIAPLRAPFEVPEYWKEAAAYLAEEDDRTVSLLVPASGSGEYAWGTTRDEIVQGLAESPWAVRNVIPLGVPGNVVFLDAVTEALESGRPSPVLADVLAAHGVGRLVVRNDLERLTSGAPDPVVLHQALDRSPGLRRTKSFGPLVGDEAVTTVDGGVRVVARSGRAARYPAVEVYDVERATAPVALVPASDVQRVVGGPGALLDGAAPDVVPRHVPTVLAADADAPSEVLLTDGLRRREKAFAAVRRNESATRSTDDGWEIDRKEPNHRVLPDQERWVTTEELRGVASVEATSSESDASAGAPLNRGHLPFAAVDGDASTEWRSAREQPAEGQRWTVAFEDARDLERVRIRLGDTADGAVEELVLSTSGRRVTVPAPGPGGQRTYPLRWRAVDRLTVEARGGGAAGQFALAEVGLGALAPRRFLRLPAPPPAADVTGVLLRRDRGPADCTEVDDVVVCDDATVVVGEDGNRLDRLFRVPGATYEIAMRGSALGGEDAVRALRRLLPVRVDASSQAGRQLAKSELAAVDGDLGTAWTSAGGDDDPRLTLRWPAPVRLESLRLRVAEAAPVAAPTRVTMRWSDGGRQRARSVRLDERGVGTFPPIRTDRLAIHVDSAREAFSVEGQRFVALPVGVSEVELNGSDALTGARGERGVRVPCGAGPEVVVDGTTVRTAATATLGDLMTGASLEVEPCGAAAFRLAGDTSFSASPSALLALDEASLLSREAVRQSTVRPEVRHPEIVRWEDAQRLVDLPARTERTLLVVAENENPGWQAWLDGEQLEPQRVDGWQQGWWVPSGAAARLELGYAPQPTYRAGLLGGVLGALVVLALAVVRRRPAERATERAPLGAAPASVLDGIALGGALGLVAGWWGAGLALLAAGARWLPAVRRPASTGATAAAAAAGLVLLGGVALAVERETRGALDSATGQLAAAAALAVFLVLVGANGPRFFRRRTGRSRR